MRAHLAHQRLELGRGAALVGQRLDLDLEEAVGLDELADDRPALALDQDLDGAVGQAQQLDDRAQRADRVDVVGHRLVGARPTLGRQQDLLLAARGGRLFQGADRFLASHEQRDHHVRKDDRVAQGKQRDTMDNGDFLRSVVVLSLMTSFATQSAEAPAARTDRNNRPPSRLVFPDGRGAIRRALGSRRASMAVSRRCGRRNRAQAASTTCASRRFERVRPNLRIGIGVNVHGPAPGAAR